MAMDKPTKFADALAAEKAAGDAFDAALLLIVTEVVATFDNVSDQMEGNPRPTRVTYYQRLNGRNYAVQFTEMARDQEDDDEEPKT